MRRIITISIILISIQLNGQNYGHLNGNTQLNHQNFQEDVIIGADARPPFSSGYTNLLYNYNQFTIGVRIEAYHNTIPGLNEYEGHHLYDMIWPYI